MCELIGKLYFTCFCILSTCDDLSSRDKKEGFGSLSREPIVISFSLCFHYEWTLEASNIRSTEGAVNDRFLSVESSAVVGVIEYQFA